MRLTLGVCIVLLVAVLALAGCSDSGVINPNEQTGQASTAVDAQEPNTLWAANNSVPFRARIHNTIENVAPFPPPAINAIFEGGGKSKPFGPFEFYSTSEVVVIFFPFIQTGTATLTYPDGAELYFDYAGTAVQDPNGIVDFNGDFTFTGGTGRFSHATGGGTYAGSADVVAEVGGFDMDGVIADFGGN